MQMNVNFQVERLLPVCMTIGRKGFFSSICSETNIYLTAFASLSLFESNHSLEYLAMNYECIGWHIVLLFPSLFLSLSLWCIFPVHQYGKSQVTSKMPTTTVRRS